MPVILRWLLRLGPTNPIAVRLVQNGSRRSRHMFIRAAYLGVLIIVLLWALITLAPSGADSYAALAKAGSNSFKFIAYLQIGLICVLAPVFMAGAIAQEADPKTWDILLTTPLSAPQIVLGNLFGRLFFILALLFCSLPLFAVTQYFGGVPGSSIFASYLIAACAALLVGSAAIALSVSRLVGRRAVFAFYVAVISYLAITWAIDRVYFGGGGVSWMTAINPFLSLHALLDPTGYPRAKPGSIAGIRGWFHEAPVTTWCALSAGLSLLLMVVSCITVRIGGFVAVTGGGTRTGQVPWYRRMAGLGAAGSDVRSARNVWHNPIAWREAAARNATLGRILARWAFIAMGAVWALIILWGYHSGTWGAGPGGHDNFRQILLYTVMGELAVVALVAVNMSATAVSREREDGTLDLLLTTPISPGQYLQGKLAGIVAYLLPLLAVPLGTLLLVGAYVALNGLGRSGGVEVAFTPPGGTATTVPVVLPEAGLVASLVTIPFAALCVIIGMQRSLASKGTIGSVMATVGIVAAIAATLGVCGWKSGEELPVIGPIIAALSPAATVFSCINPENGLAKTLIENKLGSARVGLAIGSLVSAAAMVGAVYAIRSAMTKSFDMTVRRLAGIR
ncbi:MAG: ABC transporter permease subunit [Phycisphaerae bacterium]|nr:ABC transporter permease subunit [Phycisphaerae bacterium]